MSSEKSQRLYDATRRTFVKATAAIGLAGAGAGAAVGQETMTAGGTTFVLGGATAGWEGRSPSNIEGQTNPTLQLEPGTDYVIEWENVDGQPHNVVIGDGDGNDIVRSEIISEQGQTQRVEFTAEEAMSTYYCEVHPQSMRGDVQTGTATGTETGTEEPAPRLIEKGPSVGLQQVASGPLQQPISFQYAEGGEDRRFIADQNGYVYIHGTDGIEEEPFLDITEELHYLTETKGDYPRPEEGNFDERGLVGLALHPDFANNGKFYVRYSAPPKENIEDYVGPSGRQLPEAVDHTFRLSEFTANDDGSSADPESERVLLEIPEPQFNHNSGDLAFGPDGYLYVTVGDGGGANDTHPGHVDDWYDGNAGGNGQNVTTNLLGSILRIDVDATSGESGTTEATEAETTEAGATTTEGGESGGDGLPYGIPEDNPLVGEDGFDEQFAWGVRNPWRISFNDGRLYAADVGQALFEEVNVIENGGNYGWNVKEGTHCFSAENPTQPPEECPTSTPDDVRDGEELRDPVIQYPHTYEGVAVGTSVTGGYVYGGDALSDLQGQYVFADWSRSFTRPQGRLFVSTPDSDGGEDGTWTIQELMVDGSENQQINRFITAFGRDGDGEVYALTSTQGGVKGQGEVYRLVPAGEGDSISAPSGESTATATATATETQQDPQSGTDMETTEAESMPTEEEPTATDDGAGTTENEGGQPGFGVLATLGGIGSAAAYLLGRDDNE